MPLVKLPPPDTQIDIPPLLGLNFDLSVREDMRAFTAESAEAFAIGDLDGMYLGRPWAAWHRKGFGEVAVLVALPELWEDRTNAAWRKSMRALDAETWLLGVRLRREGPGHWQVQDGDYAGRYEVGAHEFVSPELIARAMSGRPFGEARQAAEALHRLTFDASFSPALTEAVDSWRGDVRVRGVTPRGEREYVALAVRYILQARVSRSPLSDLATEFGKSPILVRKSLREARSRGLLTEAVNGRASGHLTERARQVLRDILNNK